MAKKIAHAIPNAHPSSTGHHCGTTSTPQHLGPDRTTCALGQTTVHGGSRVPSGGRMGSGSPWRSPVDPTGPHHRIVVGELPQLGIARGFRRPR
jgi:hypothetical protein